MIKETEKSELIKFEYNFIRFYQNYISSDFTRQLLSLKECLKITKIKTIKDELCEIFCGKLFFVSKL